MNWVERVHHVHPLLDEAGFRIALAVSGVLFRGDDGGRYTLCDDGCLRDDAGRAFRGKRVTPTVPSDFVVPELTRIFAIHPDVSGFHGTCDVDLEINVKGESVSEVLGKLAVVMKGKNL